MIKNSRIEIRQGCDNNVEDMLSLERCVWPSEIRASREAFAGRLNLFAPGVAGAYVANEIVGLSTSMIINWNPDESLGSWEGVTDHGMIRNHKPTGNSLYVVSIGAERLASVRGVGSALIQTQIALGQRLGLEYIVLGSRVPGYRDWRGSGSGEVTEYLSQTDSHGLPIDPLIRFFTRQGLTIQRIVPNYMENDPESVNYGVVMFRPLQRKPDGTPL